MRNFTNVLDGFAKGINPRLLSMGVRTTVSHDVAERVFGVNEKTPSRYIINDNLHISVRKNADGYDVSMRKVN